MLLTGAFARRRFMTVMLGEIRGPYLACTDWIRNSQALLPP